MTWLSPEQEWPAHERRDAQQSLQEAKQQGWSLHPFSGHSFGKVRCPHGEHTTCEFLVLSTPRGDKAGSQTAQLLRNKLRRCAALLAETEKGQASEHLLTALERVSALVEHAETLRDSEKLAEEQDRTFTDSFHQDNALVAEELLNEALELEGRAQALEEEAWTGATAFDLGDPWPPAEGAIQLARAARERILELVGDEEPEDQVIQLMETLLDRLEQIDPQEPES